MGDLIKFFNRFDSYPPSPFLFTTEFPERFHGPCTCPFDDGALPNVRYTRRDVSRDIKVGKLGDDDWDAVEVSAGTS